MVEPDLSVRDHQEVIAIGDTAHLVAPVRNIFGIKSDTPMPMPSVTHPAIQEGRYVADVIRRRITGLAQPKPLWYWDKGELAIVGRAFGVADLRLAQFAGFPAWLVWAGVHITFSSDLRIGCLSACNGSCFPYQTSPGSNSSGGTCIGKEPDRSGSLILT